MPAKIPYHRPTHETPYEHQRWRKEDKAFYDGKEWRDLRLQFLWDNPLCKDCGHEANEVHHIKERRSHPELALDWANLMSQCTSCHLAKRRKPA